MSKVSICIPTCDFPENGTNYNNVTMLSDLLQSIRMQTFTDYEVIVSDQSTDDRIERLCEIFEIKYFKNNGSNGAENINNAINHADSEYIKTMWSDDFLIKPSSLGIMVDRLGCNDWVSSATYHCNESDTRNLFYLFKPSIKEWLPYRNYLGSPSNVLFRKSELRFDEKLSLYNDCEFYYRLWKKFGNPILINEPLIVTRNRETSERNTGSFDKELIYCRTLV